MKTTKSYILTGTPGCGKTSILKTLNQHGYPFVQEAATDLIAIEQEKGCLVPWEDSSFIDNIIEMQYERQIQAPSDMSNVLFFDRSPMCTYALTQYLKFTPSPALINEIQRVRNEKIYENEVFFIDNLGFIENTDARQISFEQALVFEKLHQEAYKHFGYKLIYIPPLTVEARAKKILSTLDLLKRK